MRSATRKPEPKLVAAIAPFCENSPSGKPRGCFVSTGQFLDAEFVLANLDATRRNTSPLVKQGLASDRDLPGLQSHAGKRAYVYYVQIQVS